MNIGKLFIVALGVFFAAPPLPSGADGAPIHPAPGPARQPDLALILTVAEDPASGLATLAYEIVLGDVPAVEWEIRGFSVWRDPREGAIAAIGAPEGWAASLSPRFLDWEVVDDGASITADGPLGGFTYTQVGDLSRRHLYRYLVSRDGGAPFRIVSREPPTRISATVPEPTSGLLIGPMLVALLAGRTHIGGGARRSPHGRQGGRDRR